MYVTACLPSKAVCLDGPVAAITVQIYTAEHALTKAKCPKTVLETVMYMTACTRINKGNLPKNLMAAVAVQYHPVPSVIHTEAYDHMSHILLTWPQITSMTEGDLT